MTPQKADLSIYTPQVGIDDLALPWALRVAVTLGLPDLVDGGVQNLEDLAQRSGAHPLMLRTLMEFLSCRGVFVQLERNRYGPSPASASLKSDTAVSSWLDLDGVGGSIDSVWGGLLESTRTGEPAFHAIHGRDFWSALERSPSIERSFANIMEARAASVVTEIVDSHDWERYGCVVDVGGGTGELLIELLRRHPTMKGELVERTVVADLARGRFARCGLSDRTRVHDLAEQRLPDCGDAYVLAFVLHDWPDDGVIDILERCRWAGRDQGAVIIVEWPPNDVVERTAMNLRLAVLGGGRARDVDELSALALEAGLLVTDHHTSPTGGLLIECRPGGRQLRDR